jgi:hypothetical protein
MTGAMSFESGFEYPLAELRQLKEVLVTHHWQMAELPSSCEGN